MGNTSTDFDHVPSQVDVPISICTVEDYSNPDTRTKVYTEAMFRSHDQEDFLKAVLYVRYYANLFKRLISFDGNDKVIHLSIEEYKKALVFIDNVKTAVEWARCYGNMHSSRLFAPRILHYADGRTGSCVEVESVYYLYFLYMEKTLYSLKHCLDTGFSEPFYGYDENHDDNPYVFISPFDKRHWSSTLEHFMEWDITACALPFDNINAVSIDTVDYYEAMFFNYRTHPDGKPSDELSALPS